MKSKQGMKQEAENRLREIVAEVLLVDPEQVTLMSRLSEDLGADSLDMAELAIEIEEWLDCSGPVEEKLESCRTFAELAAAVETLRLASAAR